MFFKLLYGKIKRLKHAVMRSYSVLAMHKKDAWKYIMHAIFAMFPSKKKITRLLLLKVV